MARKMYGVHLHLPTMTAHRPSGVGFDYVEVSVTVPSGERYELTYQQLAEILAASSLTPFPASPVPTPNEQTEEADTDTEG